LLTTPGAAKWYRAEGGIQGGGGASGDVAGPGAEQNLHFSVGRDAVLEWLPRENIFFRGSDISMNVEVALSGSAKYLGWEILSFGRRAGGERWDRGRLRMRTCVRRDGRMLWLETANIDARSGFAASAVGLAGATVSGTFLVATGEVDDGLLKQCREVDASWRDVDTSWRDVDTSSRDVDTSSRDVDTSSADVSGKGARIGVTRVPGVLVARYLGHSTQHAFHWFTQLWSVLRPAMLGREHCSPRVWAC
jgi:urease accessory protein